MSMPQFRLDNPVRLPLEAKEPCLPTIQPFNLLRMLQAAIAGQLKLLGILTFDSLPEDWINLEEKLKDKTHEDYRYLKKLLPIKQAWLAVHHKLSDTERAACRLLQEKFKKMQAALSSINLKPGEDFTEYFDKVCANLAEVLASFPEEKSEEKSAELPHIKLDSNRLTFLIENLFAARQALLSKNKDPDKEQKTKSPTPDFGRFFQAPTPQYQEPYTIPNQHHQFWDGSKLPGRYLNFRLGLAKRANKCRMNMHSYDDHVLGNTLVPCKVEYDKTLLLDLALSHRHRVRSVPKELYPKIKKLFKPEIARELITMLEVERVGNKNYSAVSDLIRYLLMLVEGGWYCDTDMEVINYSINDSFESLFRDTLPKILSPEELSVFRAGCDLDFRGATFDPVLNKLRVKLLLEPLKRVKTYFSPLELKDIENKLGQSVWEGLATNDKNYKALYLRQFVPKFIHQFLNSSNGHPRFPELKEALIKKGFLLNIPTKKYYPHELRAFSEILDTWDRDYPGLIPHWKACQISEWRSLLTFLKVFHYSLQQPNSQAGLHYESDQDDSNVCFLGAAPHHPTLYQVILNYLERFKMYQYQKPLDLSFGVLTRGVMRAGDPGGYWMDVVPLEQTKPWKVAEITQYTLMDCKRSKHSLVWNTQRKEAFSEYPLDRVPRRLELGIALGVSVLTSDNTAYTEGRGVNINTLFGLQHKGDASWVEGKPKKLVKTYAFDTTDCRRKPFKEEGQWRQVGLSF